MRSQKFYLTVETYFKPRPTKDLTNFSQIMMKPTFSSSWRTLRISIMDAQILANIIQRRCILTLILVSKIFKMLQIFFIWYLGTIAL